MDELEDLKHKIELLQHVKYLSPSNLEYIDGEIKMIAKRLDSLSDFFEKKYEKMEKDIVALSLLIDNECDKENIKDVGPLIKPNGNKKSVKKYNNQGDLKYKN